MSFDLNFIPHSYIQEPQKLKDPVLPEEAMKLANEMDPEELCHFLTILKGLRERGVSQKELLRGIGVEQILDVEKVIRQMVIDKLNIIELGNIIRPVDHEKPTGESGKVLQFSVKFKSEPMPS